MRRHFLQADFHTVLAPWSKGTALWRIQHIHGRTFDRNQALVIFRINTGHRTKQAHGVGMGWIVENIINRPLLHNLSSIHNGYLVADFCYNTQIVSDKDNAHVGLFLQGLHQFQNLSLNGYVQGSGGLVGNQQLRMTNQAHGNHYTLTHSTRKLVGILLHALFHIVDSHQFQHFHGSLCSFFLGNIFVVGPQGFYQLISNGVHRIQTGHGILENHGHILSPEGSHLVLCHGKYILAFKGNASSYNLSWRLEQSHDGIGFLTLSRTRLTNDSHYLSIVQVVGNSTYCLHFSSRSKEGNL